MECRIRYAHIVPSIQWKNRALIGLVAQYCNRLEIEASGNKGRVDRSKKTPQPNGKIASSMIMNIATFMNDDMSLL